MTGRVKWFNDAKGYGFITCDDGQEVLVHRTGLVVEEDRRAALTEGDVVEFEVAESPKGRKAVSVRRVEPAGS